MNVTTNTNQRLTTILLVLLALHLILLIIIGIFAVFAVMSNGTMMSMGGMMNNMMGMNRQTTNDMMNACANMMQNFPRP